MPETFKDIMTDMDRKIERNKRRNKRRKHIAIKQTKLVYEGNKAHSAPKERTHSNLIKQKIRSLQIRVSRQQGKPLLVEVNEDLLTLAKLQEKIK